MIIRLTTLQEKGDRINEEGIVIDEEGHNILDGSGDKITLDTEDLLNAYKEYAKYVKEYPETHDEGSYPACFLEWFSNDYINED
jgi:hypothetical protein